MGTNGLNRVKVFELILFSSFKMGKSVCRIEINNFYDKIFKENFPNRPWISSVAHEAFLLKTRNFICRIIYILYLLIKFLVKNLYGFRDLILLTLS